MRSFYHIIQEKRFVLFWMCDFVALTRCLKRIKFFRFNICCFNSKFNKAYRMPNTWPTTHPSSGKFLPCPLSFPKTKLCTKFEVPSSSSFKDMFDCMPKIVGVTWPVPRPFWESYLCTGSAFHMRIYGPNLKSLALIVLKISWIILPENLGITWPKPRPFCGNLFVHPLGFPKAKLCI